MEMSVNLSVTDDSPSVSDRVIIIYSWVVYSTVCQLLNVFGIVTNIINIACFVKQGFKDSVNVSLLGLSVSDLGSLVTTAWTCISFTPAVLVADLPFDSIDIAYIAALPHFAFTRVSSCITAMITLEKCLCVIAPLKIKSIITPKREAAVTIVIFIIFWFSITPVYVVNKLGLKISQTRNKTIIGLIFTEDRENVEKISFAINNFTIPFGAFMIISICTIILSIKLREKTEWRKKVTVSTQADGISSRNLRVAKMVLMISTLFIFCFIPSSISILTIAFMPELSVLGKQVNIGIIVIGLCCTMESINSSMNIFIYYHMSSKYRQTLCRMFSRANENVLKANLNFKYL